ncbi:uncharacterized protein Dwil_GK27164 [Drosophila willistoni]|uniref:uncharacterized protein LOC26529166 n=1 Tax=Drosophila willistoni TaxID=7260 RepID=UPI0007328573|nr:uncharacterized protein LOC26529166 [Drosophila willistoni]KRF99070.1 uncharacterized protein Dwil_GK27164 [Drosophila willistoni]
MQQMSSKQRTTYLNERLVTRTYGKQVLLNNWESERAASSQISNGILPGLSRFAECEQHVSETKANFSENIYRDKAIKQKYIQQFLDRYRNRLVNQSSHLTLIPSQIYQNNFTSTNTIVYDIEPKVWLHDQRTAACNAIPKHPKDSNLVKDYGSQTRTGARRRIRQDIKESKQMNGGCMATTYQTFYGGISAGNDLRH